MALPRAILLIQWPDGRAENRPLADKSTRIGRQPGSAVPIPPEWVSISGQHAELRPSADGWRLVDLASSNGTFVDGKRITGEVLLRPEQVITIGSAERGQQISLTISLPDAGTLPIPATPEQRSAPTPTLSVRWPSGEEVSFPITADVVRVGRHPASDLVVPVDLRIVSTQHFEIRHTQDGFVAIDLGSTNGTRINSNRLTPHAPSPLYSGDILRIGDDRYGASIGFTFTNPADSRAPFRGFTASVDIAELTAQRITIGRDPACDIVLDSPQVARQHAVLELMLTGVHRLRVLDTVAGVLVNNVRVSGQANLSPGDLIQVGPHLLTYDGEKLIRFDSQGYRLDVVDVHKEVQTPRGKIRILDDISLTILPREFIALVGGSGAGKSTLLDALNGFRPARGDIIVNGQNFYQEYDAFRTQLGYVPQYDILHNSLKVEAALDYAARLRLPPDLSPAERQERIGQVLETVGLNTDKVRSTRIDNLSGGQRKRVSIAAELLADPKLFFLDEPTSGLDPGLEKKMMYLLRQMADEGRTIVLITHATGNIVQVDHVAFLSQGRLIYFGPPQPAIDYFEVEDFADIYEKIERHGAEWREVFTAHKPHAYQTYVLERQQQRPLPPAQRAETGPRTTFSQMLNQFWVFSRRTFHIIFTEPISMVILLAVMPLVAFMLLLVTAPDVLSGDKSILSDVAAAANRLTENYLPAGDARITLFAMGLLAVLVGLFGSSNELIKERSVFLRERMVNLRLIPYIGSKFLVFGVFALIQCTLLLFVLLLDVRIPLFGSFLPALLELFITLFLTTMASVALGLFISSISRSSTMATYLILIVLFVQIIFSGAIFNLSGKPSVLLSYLTTTRWSLIALGTSLDVPSLGDATIVCVDEQEVDPDSVEDAITIYGPGDIEIDQDRIETRETGQTACFNRPLSDEDLYLPYGEGAIGRPLTVMSMWIILGVFGAIFTAGTFIMVKRLDSVEVRLG